MVRRVRAWVSRWRDWTGLGPYTELPGQHRGKTLWDLMGLLIVPAVLATGIWYLNHEERRAERVAAEARAQADREIALDRARAAALESYLDHMHEIVANTEHPLRNSPRGADIRALVGALTVATLHELDGERKGTLVRYLSDCQLVQAQENESTEVAVPVISLAFADLRGAHLARMDLAGANLAGADLSNANLTGADLRRANLLYAITSGADFTDAILEGATIRTESLVGQRLRETH